MVVIGNFDGVHRGHVELLRIAKAAEPGAPLVAVTFWPHPMSVVRPDQVPLLLTTLEGRKELLRNAGVDDVVVVHFTPEVASWSPAQFVDAVIRPLHPARVVVGENFRFGHKAAGTVEFLMERGPALGFTAERVELLEVDGRRVSSSSIRDALSRSDLEWPRVALGRRFVLDGTVVSGAGRGHGLGFPTANLRTGPRLLLPGRGIYAGRAVVDGEGYVAAISVGTNPTFGSEPLHVEAYLLDFDGDLVGSQIAVEFWAYLRDEERFDTPGQLSAAIGEDVRRTRDLAGDA